MESRRSNWHGSFAVIVTPFTRDGEIDEPGYRKVIDLVIEAGCHGIIAAGSTGEFFLMSHDERKRVFELAVDQTGGRIPVLAGTSAIRTEEVIDLTAHARTLGCAGCLLLPPLYARLKEREVYEFYRRVSSEAGLPTMLYNSPFAVRAYLTPSLVEQLMKLDNVVAIKDSSQDMRQMNALVKYCGQALQVFTGHEDLLLPSLAVGAVGAVAMVPQIVGRMAVDIYERAVVGDWQGAKELHHKIVRVYDLFKIGGGYMAIKECMNALGKPGGHSRPPTLPLTANEKAQLREILEDVGLLTATRASV